MAANGRLAKVLLPTARINIQANCLNFLCITDSFQALDFGRFVEIDALFWNEVVLAKQKGKIHLPFIFARDCAAEEGCTRQLPESYGAKIFCSRSNCQGS